MNELMRIRYGKKDNFLVLTPPSTGECFQNTKPRDDGIDVRSEGEMGIENDTTSNILQQGTEIRRNHCSKALKSHESEGFSDTGLPGLGMEMMIISNFLVNGRLLSGRERFNISVRYCRSGHLLTVLVAEGYYDDPRCLR